MKLSVEQRIRIVHFLDTHPCVQLGDVAYLFNVSPSRISEIRKEYGMMLNRESCERVIDYITDPEPF
jgi:hypothetical protein